MNEVTLKAHEGEMTVEGLPLIFWDGKIWVDGNTEVYDFDNEIIGYYDSAENEFEITLTRAQLEEAKAHREYVESITAEDFEDEIDAD